MVKVLKLKHIFVKKLSAMKLMVINKIKMLKTFNRLGLDILALGYSSQFFLIDSEKFKLIKHL